MVGKEGAEHPRRSTRRTQTLTLTASEAPPWARPVDAEDGDERSTVCSLGPRRGRNPQNQKRGSVLLLKEKTTLLRARPLRREVRRYKRQEKAQTSNSCWSCVSTCKHWLLFLFLILQMCRSENFLKTG